MLSRLVHLSHFTAIQNLYSFYFLIINFTSPPTLVSLFYFCSHVVQACAPIPLYCHSKPLFFLHPDHKFYSPPPTFVSLFYFRSESPHNLNLNIFITNQTSTNKIIPSFLTCTHHSLPVRCTGPLSQSWNTINSLSDCLFFKLSYFTAQMRIYQWM
jgi:hypothetical protein